MVKHTPILQILWKKGMQTNSGAESRNCGRAWCSAGQILSPRFGLSRMRTVEGMTRQRFTRWGGELLRRQVDSVGRQAAPCCCGCSRPSGSSSPWKVLTSTQRSFFSWMSQALSIYADFGGVQMLVLFVSSVYGLQFCEF